jgi:hypothetical protein
MTALADLRLRLDSTRDPAAASRLVHWILRVSVWACYVGHGMFGIRQKVDWLTFYRPFGIPDAIALQTMPLIGLVDVTMGYLVLLRPTRVVLFYTALWGVFTALLRPLVGMSFFETLERAGNYGPSVALLLGSAGAALLARPEIYDLSVEQHFRRARQVLAITTCLLLLGHGGLALGAKPQLVQHWHSLGVAWLDANGQAFTRMAGAGELAAAALVLLWPTRPLCLAIVSWKLLTEMMFLTSGAPIWEVVERGGSYGAPLAVFVLLSYGGSRARSAASVPSLDEQQQVGHPVMAGSSARLS